MLHLLIFLQQSMGVPKPTESKLSCLINHLIKNIGWHLPYQCEVTLHCFTPVLFGEEDVLGSGVLTLFFPVHNLTTRAVI